MTKTKTNTQAVHRFVLTAMGPCVAMLPPGAKITTCQPHKKGVEIYALVNPEVEAEPRDFYVAKTGEIVTGKTFVATVAFPGVKALHVFES